MTRLYPVALQLAGARCLVAGGGAVAERKVGALLAAGADVHVVAPDATANLRALAQTGKIRWNARPVEPTDLADCLLAVICTNDRAVNQTLAIAARQQGVLANVADAPDEGTAISPAVVERDNLLIAVWSGGGGPVVSQLVRDRVAGCIGEEWGALSRVLARCRADITRTLPPAGRAAFWRGAINEPLLALLRTGDEAGAEAILRATDPSVNERATVTTPSRRG